MQISNVGLRLIQAFEGIKDGDPSTPDLEPYLCPANVWTVGWGHALTDPNGTLIRGLSRKNLADISMRRQFGKLSITRTEADELLYDDLDIFEAEVTEIVPADTTQAQFDALVSFAFNCGPDALKSSTILRLHNQGVRAVPAIDMDALVKDSRNKVTPRSQALAFARWSNSNGKWLLGLFRRRAAEALIYGGWDINTALKARNFNG